MKLYKLTAAFKDLSFDEDNIKSWNDVLIYYLKHLEEENQEKYLLFPGEVTQKGFCAVFAVNDDATEEEDRHIRYMVSMALDADCKWSRITETTVHDFLLCANSNQSYYENDTLAREMHFDNYEALMSLQDALKKFGDGIITNRSKEEIINKSKILFFEQTLVPEIERISQRKRMESFVGHPVHYLVETDDIRKRNEICHYLMASLYENGRIKNKNYIFLHLHDRRGFDENLVDDLYKISSGGTVIIRYDQRETDDQEDRISSERIIFEQACSIARYYKKDVLTIFCIPRGQDRLKNIIYEYLNDMSLVEIKENKINTEDAKKYVEELAEKYNLTINSDLINEITEGKSYWEKELNEIFEEWLSKKIRTDIYPQYKDQPSCKTKVSTIRSN